MSLKHNSLATLFTDIADKIRQVGGGTEDIVADEFPAAIENIAGGEWLPSAETVLATFARRQSGGDGPATIEKIYGKTEVWNQLVKNGDFSDGLTSWYYRNSNVTIEADGTIKVEVLSAYNGIYQNENEVIPGIVGHKYLMAALIKTASDKCKLYCYQAPAYAQSSPDDFAWRYNLKTITSANKAVGVQLDEAGIVYVKKVRLFDLTLMYGEGKEPSTVAEFLSMHPEALTAPYDAGSLLPVKAESIITQGVNQWDEEWEAGAYNSSNGEKTGAGSFIRSKNYIPVLPGTNYYYKVPDNNTRVFFYDYNFAFIASDNTIYNSVFTTPVNCHYMTFMEHSAAITYNHDICINISDSSINGQYFPHHNSDVGLPILKHFPTGLRGVGDSYDEIGPKKKVQRRGVVDLGSLGWGGTGTFFSSVIEDMAKNSSIEGMICAKYKPRDSRPVSEDKAYYRDGRRIFIQDSAYTTAATFKAAMSGVEFEYPLAEPIETDINEDMTYLPQLGGTEEVSPISAEFKAEIRYARKISE